MSAEAGTNPAPNVPECTCDREDDSWVGEPVDMPLCPFHEKRLRHLSWDTLASLVIDFEAALYQVHDAAQNRYRWNELRADYTDPAAIEGSVT